MSTVVLHNDIAAYINRMKSFTVWYGSSVSYGDSPYSRYKKFYSRIKWVLFLVLLFVNGFCLYLLDDFGLFDGNFIYWPICLELFVLTSIARFSGQQQEAITMSLNDCFLKNTEPWMRAIKDKYISGMWKFVNFFALYNNVTLFLYLFGPLVADTILHYGFDYLQKPFALPMPLSPIFKYEDSWNTVHYVVTIINFWATAEVVFVFQWFFANFSLLTTFFLTELIIFKHQVKSLNFERDDSLDQQVEDIVNKHNQIIEMSKDLKGYLGLSAAFVCFITSLALTFTAYTMYSSSDLPLRVTYGSGFLLYFLGALLFSTLGQKLENECDEVFKALYGLRWYRFTPNARKSLNMIMRQARYPITIDYHSRYKMNLSNFMQILRSSYSYFTLLQSMASKSSASRL
uniref:Odorant receptor n=1 Tax=Adelphocoris lineolatus TaxID=236346 RepID=A0A2I4PH62_ADELI|nr:olfactory receptor 60 [Adelphocoris lineolatus]